jgi:hypothetical protein
LQRTLEHQIVARLSNFLVINPTIRETQILVDVDEAEKVLIQT